jgi:tripartite-type tricarboxylate transporter receptor subunit TctC
MLTPGEYILSTGQLSGRQAVPASVKAAVGGGGSGLFSGAVVNIGSTDTIPDLAQRAIDFTVMDGTFGSTQVKSGRIRALAVTTAERHPALPGVPTMREAGIADYDEFASWWSAWAPAGTPKPIISKLAGWFDQITRSEETREFLAGIAGSPQFGGPEETAARLEREIAKWGRVTKAAGIEPQ